MVPSRICSIFLVETSLVIQVNKVASIDWVFLGPRNRTIEFKDTFRGQLVAARKLFIVERL